MPAGTTKLSIGSGWPRNCGVRKTGEFGNLNETWFEPSIGFAPHTAPSMSGFRLLAILGHVENRRDPCCPAQQQPGKHRAKTPNLSLSSQLAKSGDSMQQQS